MKIIVTGANGFTGQHLCRMLAHKGFEVHALARGERRLSFDKKIRYHEVELTSVRAVAAVFDHVQPDVVVHTAAMSKPDECHHNRQACLLHNVEATRFLLQASRPFPVHFIYLSTDFVFGENGPHSEADSPAPLNFYGESKLMAEQLVADSGLDYAIVRPVFIYGATWPGLRPSFLHWVKDNLAGGKPIKVVTDQYRTPTYVADLCSGIEKLIIRKEQGLYHLAGKDIVSPYEMALHVARVLQLDESLLVPVTADNFPEPVQRAKRSGVTIDKARRKLGYDPVDFVEGVRLTFGISGKK